MTQTKQPPAISARFTAFDRLCKAATRREIDVVMAWSVDRLGRSLQDLVAFLSDLQASGVDLYLDRQGIDTTTPGGKALFQMMGVFAEFERAMIRERINAGLIPTALIIDLCAPNLSIRWT